MPGASRIQVSVSTGGGIKRADCITLLTNKPLVTFLHTVPMLTRITAPSLPVKIVIFAAVNKVNNNSLLVACRRRSSEYTRRGVPPVGGTRRCDGNRERRNMLHDPHGSWVVPRAHASDSSAPGSELGGRRAPRGRRRLPATLARQVGPPHLSRGARLGRAGLGAGRRAPRAKVCRSGGTPQAGPAAFRGRHRRRQAARPRARLPCSAGSRAYWEHEPGLEVRMSPTIRPYSPSASAKMRMSTMPT